MSINSLSYMRAGEMEKNNPKRQCFVVCSGLFKQEDVLQFTFLLHGIGFT